MPTILLVLRDTALDRARAFSPGADPADAEMAGFPALRATGQICTTTVEVGSGLLRLAGTDCGRQQ